MNATSTILVVDDDDGIRESLCEALHDEGYEVVPAVNGCDALGKLQDMPPPALIILDLTMPGMDGWEFRLRQQMDPRLLYVPVLVLSADLEARRKARALGVDGCLTKPVNLDRLLDTVALHCQRSSIVGHA